MHVASAAPAASPAMGHRPLFRLALFAALAAWAGCADEPAARWIPLAPREPGPDLPRPVYALPSDPLVLADGRRFERRTLAGERWLETRLAREEWSFDPDLQGGVWTLPLAVAPPVAASAGPAAVLEGERGRFEHVPESHDPSVPWRLGPGSFATQPGRLLLSLADGAEPPAELRFALRLGPEEPAGVTGRRFSGDGFALSAGGAVSLRLDVPEGSELRFATVCEPLFAPPSAPTEPVVFRVLVDGVERFRHEERELGAPEARRHVVALAEPGAHELVFEASGGPACSAFLAPRLVPRAASRAAAGDGEPRPDLVVFLADTLRADALGAYGDARGLTPNLDAFAREALVYERAWSTGTYTLPAHASMFTGAFPHQVGIVGTDRGVPDELVTVAEHLRAAGWRTGAITDSIVVSQALGLAQGFEWFDELHATLGSTLERAAAFLDDDDGRPVFLFVHTYRVHLPYRVSRRTREAWGERLGLEGDPDRLRARIQELVESPLDTPGRTRAIEEALERISRFYYAGVVDLDLGFGRFLEDLRARGILEHGNLVFASDHGEAFGEHGLIYHRDRVYDVLARVPLLVAGRGVAPGRVGWAASLVDLPRTLCALADVPPRPEWSGRALVGLDLERPAFVFECRNTPDSTLAVVEGAHKVIGSEREPGTLRAAFDLALDPREEHDQAGLAPWPRELLERSRARLDELLTPLVAPEEARLDPAQREALRAMGYGDDR